MEKKVYSGYISDLGKRSPEKVIFSNIEDFVEEGDFKSFLNDG
jgi:hypothetical protein